MKKQYIAPESATVDFFTEGNLANINLDSQNGATNIRSNHRGWDSNDSGWDSDDWSAPTEGE